MMSVSAGTRAREQKRVKRNIPSVQDVFFDCGPLESFPQRGHLMVQQASNHIRDPQYHLGRVGVSRNQRTDMSPGS